MNRESSIETLTARVEPFDILVIGGGSTGAGSRWTRRCAGTTSR